MGKLFLLCTACFAFSGCGKSPFAILFQPDVKICDLYEKQSVFADSLVQLHRLTVTKCTGMFSISYAEVTDGKCSIGLFTTKPYAKNEVIDIDARYKVMFNYNGQTISALQAEGHRFEPCSSHSENQPIRMKILIGFFIAQAVHKHLTNC